MQNEAMTVTYRRTAQEPGGEAGGGAGRSGRGGGPEGKGGRGGSRPKPIFRVCTKCQTTYGVRVDAREALIVQVLGSTCRNCNPRRAPATGPPGTGRLVTILPTRPSGGPRRIQTLSEQVSD